MFAIGAIMALSGVFAIMLSPFHQSRLGPVLAVPPTHEVLANNQLRLLPRQTAFVGDTIAIPQIRPDGVNLRFPYFQIIRQSGTQTQVVHENTSATVAPNFGQWEFPGQFEYRFFTTNTFAGEPFYVHPINIRQNQFSFVLPTNSEDILPNVSIPGLPITVPLPTSFYDTRGNNLFEIRRDANLNLYVPHIERLAALYTAQASIASCDFERLDHYRELVWEDTILTFFGNDGAMENQDGQVAHNLTYNRTFVPNAQHDNHHAVFSYINRNDTSIVATLESQRINVETVSINGVNVTNPNLVTGVGRTDSQRSNEQIRFEYRPEPAFTPTSPRYRQVMTLPDVSVSLSRETDNEELAFNPVRFSGTTENFTSFTFIRAEVFIGGPNADRNNDNLWRLARTLDWLPAHGDAPGPNGENASSFYHRITDFEFIPTEMLEVRFTYFTTTIFGAGYDYSGWRNEHIRWVNRHGIPLASGATGNPGNGDQRMIRYRPFTRFFVPTDNVPPRIMWTNEFDFDAQGNAVYYGTTDAINFDNTENLERFLPTRTGAANRHTQIASNPTGALSGTNAHLLTLPALLGWDNDSTAEDITYTIRITRILPGITNTSVQFSNSRSLATGSGGLQPFDPRRELVIDFSTPGPVNFTNGAFNGNLDGSGSLVPSGSSRDAQYRIEVFARDESGQYSGTLSYTFEVVGTVATTIGATTGFRMHLERPDFQGGLNLRQDSFNDGDTIRWRELNPSDDFTNTSNIELTHFLVVNGQLPGGQHHQHTVTSNWTTFFDISDEIEILGGNQAAFELNPNESQIVQTLIGAIGSDGFLDVRMVAVARNFFAMNNDFQFNLEHFIEGTIDDQHPGIQVTEAQFNLFTPEFGSAATIRAGAMLSPQALAISNAPGNAWDTLLIAENAPVLEQYQPVNLPQFIFHYQDELQAIASSFSISITAEDGKAEPVLPFAGASPSIGTAAAPFGTSSLLWGPFEDYTNIYFIPMSVGRHVITVQVTNNGGNVTVFMATIHVVGEVHYDIFPDQNISTLYVGQSMSSPSVQVIIHNTEFRSVGNRIEAVGHPGSDYGTVTPVIHGGAFTFNNNLFTPGEAATYTFTFLVQIPNNAALQALIPAISPLAGPINAHATHQVVVRNMAQGSLGINLLTGEYAALENHVDLDPDLHILIPQFGHTMTHTGIRTITVSDATLEAGMHESVSGTPGVYEYGHIVLPNWQVVIATNEGFLPPNFNPDFHITVQAPRSQPGEYILDTRDDSSSENRVYFGTGQDATRHYFFQPIGQLNTQTLANRTIANRINHDIFADGIYIVTYHGYWNGITVELIFHIQIGDIERPTIHFTTTEYERLFSSIWTHGTASASRFEIDTSLISVNNNGGKTDFTPLYIAENMTIQIIGPGGAIGPGDGGRDSMENGDFRAHFGPNGFRRESNVYIPFSGAPGRPSHVAEADWGRQIWDFYLTQVGTYTITLSIQSESGVEGIFQRTVTVQQSIPGTTIDPSVIWGIILIVLAVGIFLGVLFYFIKTGRQTKFATVDGKKVKAEAKAEKPDQV